MRIGMARIYLLVEALYLGGPGAARGAGPGGGRGRRPRRFHPWFFLCAGCVPSVTVRRIVLGPRRIVTCMLSPGRWSAIAATRSLELPTGASPSLVTTSPAWMPALAAGPPAVTWPMAAPPVWLGPSEVATPM